MITYVPEREIIVKYIDWIVVSVCSVDGTTSATQSVTVVVLCVYGRYVFLGILDRVG